MFSARLAEADRQVPSVPACDKLASTAWARGAPARIRAGGTVSSPGHVGFERLRQAERSRVAAEAKATEQRKKRKVQMALVAAIGLLLAGGGAFLLIAVIETRLRAHASSGRA